ncbi:SgcJ/EcaC family oxidoreductase [Actinomadura soli]|uniref:SgcJ/EcaC family oxidoreductase n=1 Tax=Actinomadura soli TaxID=2508997 RepID=A0A5C4JDV4_9ACTN|nr:SgcJ/EcaC family oxidoreductase [Actinomadura soli]TMR02188.1 SgcJ/EcaC family oxidoreductase [Actinomadura soli]
MTGHNTTHVDAERAVRAVLDEVYAAWAQGDADAFVVPYAETATATLPGTYLPSKEAIRDTMARLFTGAFEGSKGIHKVRNIRFVCSDLAIVSSQGAVVFAGQTEPGSSSLALETWVLSEEDGAWRVQAFHSTPEHTG